MGKTKTAFVAGTEESKLTGAEKYQERQKKKAEFIEKSGIPVTDKKTAPVKPVKERVISKNVEKPKKVHLSGLKGGQRVKIVGEDAPPNEIKTENTAASGETKIAKKAKAIRIRGKKYLSSRAKVDRNRLYSVSEAVALTTETSYSSFTGTVEMHLVVKKTGLTAKINLPYSTGKERKIEFATDATIEKLKQGKIDFDILLATAAMMPALIPFAKLLGPKGLMPNPKNGTIVKSEKEAGKFSGNSLTLKTEKEQPVIHTVIGKVNQDSKELEDNAKAVLDGIGRPVIVRCFIKATMGPAIKVKI